LLVVLIRLLMMLGRSFGVLDWASCASYADVGPD
jgi:hypothetical protein